MKKDKKIVARILFIWVLITILLAYRGREELRSYPEIFQFVYCVSLGFCAVLGISYFLDSFDRISKWMNK